MPARLARLCAWPWWKGGKELPGGDCCVGGCCGVPGLGKARWLATSEGSYDNCAWEWERNGQEVESQSQLLPMQASSGSSSTPSLHLVHRIHDVSPTRKVRSTHPNPAPGGLCGSLLLPPPWCGQLRCGSISILRVPRASLPGVFTSNNALPNASNTARCNRAKEFLGHPHATAEIAGGRLRTRAGESLLRL